jgi:HD-GYP domain-containing protein (c-di-GMP phosphodiesterase class II)
MERAPERCHLAELVVAVAIATDLGTGQPLGHALRTTLRSVSLAERAGLDTDERVTTYWLALLRFVGCTATAHDDAVKTGDELAFYAGAAPLVNGENREFLSYLVREFAAGQSSMRRARLVAGMLSDPGGPRRAFRIHCDAGQLLARQAGLDGAVVEALGGAFERWDGRGYPERLRGDAIPRPCRVVAVARDVELFIDAAGWDAAAQVLERRRGRAYDPDVVDAALAIGAGDASPPDDDLVGAVLAAEPGRRRTVTDDELDRVLAAWGDFADLKSPWAAGHSRRVADLAAAAGARLGFDDADVRRLRHAALVHDLGHVGVPAGVRAKRTPLTADDRERLRLHPYLTERILTRAPALADLAPIAGAHHERIDASGYHKGIGRAALPEGALVLAAADAWDGARHERAHRPAAEPHAAAARLEAEVAAGRLDGRATAAVLAAAGQPLPSRVRTWPADLTDREVDVLRLLAGGRSNKQVARVLGISPKTVGRHVEHIYSKTGVRTRAAAVLFAMGHGLTDPPDAGPVG